MTDTQYRSLGSMERAARAEERKNWLVTAGWIAGLLLVAWYGRPVLEAVAAVWRAF